MILSCIIKNPLTIMIKHDLNSYIILVPKLGRAIARISNMLGAFGFQRSSKTGFNSISGV
jgi:hypothetical protein